MVAAGSRAEVFKQGRKNGKRQWDGRAPSGSGQGPWADTHLCGLAPWHRAGGLALFSPIICVLGY